MRLTGKLGTVESRFGRLKLGRPFWPAPGQADVAGASVDPETPSVGAAAVDHVTAAEAARSLVTSSNPDQSIDIRAADDGDSEALSADATSAEHAAVAETTRAGVTSLDTDRPVSISAGDKTTTRIEVDDG